MLMEGDAKRQPLDVSVVPRRDETADRMINIYCSRGESPAAKYFFTFFPFFLLSPTSVTDWSRGSPRRRLPVGYSPWMTGGAYGTRSCHLSGSCSTPRDVRGTCKTLFVLYLFN
jgi:hypothetical protein